MYTVWYNSYLDADKQEKLNQREAVTIEDVMRWNREIKLIEAEPKTLADLVYEKEVTAREDDAVFMANHQGDNMVDEEDLAEDKYFPYER